MWWRGVYICVAEGMWDYTSPRSNEYKFRESEQPLDTVSEIVWDRYKNDPCFLTGGWDGFFRYYMVDNKEVARLFEIFLEHPVLAIDVTDNNVGLAGLSSGHVAAINLQN